MLRNSVKVGFLPVLLGYAVYCSVTFKLSHSVDVTGA